jgi:hypothetical protein
MVIAIIIIMSIYESKNVMKVLCFVKKQLAYFEYAAKAGFTSL